MYKTFNSILTIIWILDITNMPFMEFLDTTYPVNGLIWLLIWLSIPSITTTYKVKNKNNKDDE